MRALIKCPLCLFFSFSVNKKNVFGLWKWLDLSKETHLQSCCITKKKRTIANLHCMRDGHGPTLFFMFNFFFKRVSWENQD